jgi:hypothetical protein
MAMAMAMLPGRPEGDYRVSFKVRDFISALGIGYGGDTKRVIRAAVEEALAATISIDMANGDWVGYTWFSESRLTDLRFEWEWGWGTITMEFNPKLGAALKQIKGYTKIDLLNLGKLQSRYAIRYHEIALSWAGLEGKDGNPPGTWYFEMSLEDIKKRFMIDEKKYKATKDFRVTVIDKPLEDLNAARIGLRIEPEYIRRGRFLYGVRFNCRRIAPDEPILTAPATESGRQDEQLINTYPKEFQKYYEVALKVDLREGNLFNVDQTMRENMAKNQAVDELRRAHMAPRKRGRGRPRKVTK